MHEVSIVHGRAEFATAESAMWDPASIADVSHDRDAVIEGLVEALLKREKAEDVSRSFDNDMLLSQLMSRLTDLRNKSIPGEKQPRTVALQRWRLERVNRFIDANIDRPIRLEALARASGLSPMYFAAQFRAATGVRPHDYVLRRRVQRAKSLLAAPNSSIVDVALSVGFQSQAHFTTVFKRIVGLPPRRWREHQSRIAA